MHHKQPIHWFLILILLSGARLPAAGAHAAPPTAGLAQSSGVTAFDLILATNTLRMSYGLPALVEDPIVNAVAQSTAETMAASQMSGHIGNVTGRLAAAGYGGGAKVWATENFAVGNYAIDEIMQIWSDELHMLPVVIPSYCNVGAGVARSANGQTYYVLQAAYTAAESCGKYESVAGTPAAQSSGSAGVSQLIIPVKIATPDADGRTFHVVAAGQSFWAIAIAYKITIKDLEIWNNLSRDSKLLIGQRLFIPGGNTQGYATPTPVGMVQISTPDRDGKIIHVVQAYHTLITIAQAYKTTIETILSLNGIQADVPLQIGQKLIIHPGSVTPSPTPRPLTPIEKLTPASDGKYYHSIRSGETLSWIAQYYAVSIFDLMAWNGLNTSSIIQPEQKLLLQVTPPATETPIPAPATATPTATITPRPPTPTFTQSPSQAAPMLTDTPEPASSGAGSPFTWVVFIVLAGGGLLLGLFLSRKKPS